MPDRKPPRRRASAEKPVLLSGGNPQIAKAEGDQPVAAYIAAMPGWKREVGACLDALIVASVPDLRKAVKWNSPFYGVADQGWFMAFHCFTRAVKVTFFSVASISTRYQQAALPRRHAGSTSARASRSTRLR